MKKNALLLLSALVFSSTQASAVISDGTLSQPDFVTLATTLKAAPEGMPEMTDAERARACQNLGMRFAYNSGTYAINCGNPPAFDADAVAFDDAKFVVCGIEGETSEVTPGDAGCGLEADDSKGFVFKIFIRAVTETLFRVYKTLQNHSAGRARLALCSAYFDTLVKFNGEMAMCDVSCSSMGTDCNSKCTGMKAGVCGGVTASCNADNADCNSNCGTGEWLNSQECGWLCIDKVANCKKSEETH